MISRRRSGVSGTGRKLAKRHFGALCCGVVRLCKVVRCVQRKNGGLTLTDVERADTDEWSE